jgi:6-phosphogluconolactonase
LEQAAGAYEAELKSFYGSDRLDPGRPLFAVNLLGLGPDGHTASLFPGTAALDETSRWVTTVVGAKDEDRVTLTYPAIASSRHVVFLTQGEEKRAMLRRLLEGDVTIPAGRVTSDGDITVMADEAAAR